MKLPSFPRGVLLGALLVALGVVLLFLGLGHAVDGYSILVLSAGVALITAGVRDLGDSPPPGAWSLMTALDTPENRAEVLAVIRKLLDEWEQRPAPAEAP